MTETCFYGSHACHACLTIEATIYPLFTRSLHVASRLLTYTRLPLLTVAYTIPIVVHHHSLKSPLTRLIVLRMHSSSYGIAFRSQIFFARLVMYFLQCLLFLFTFALPLF